MSDVKWWRETRWILPAWITAPLMTVGLFFLIAKPIGYADWVGYCLIVIIAALIGLVFRRRYDATVIDSTERTTTVLYTKR
jgi:hypothetical protein